jgi:hypothetical protein
MQITVKQQSNNQYHWLLEKTKYYIHVHAPAGLISTCKRKRWKGNREIIPAIKNHNGTIITDTTENANILNPYYASVFCCDRKILVIKLANWGEIFIINTKVIGNRLAKIWRRESLGPGAFLGEILKLGVECMSSYLTRLLVLSLENATISRGWKISTVVPTYQRRYRWALSNYRHKSLTSAVCKQLEHVISSYLSKSWIRIFGYTRDSVGLDRDTHVLVITVCQTIADS